MCPFCPEKHRCEKKNWFRMGGVQNNFCGHGNWWYWGNTTISFQQFPRQSERQTIYKWKRGEKHKKSRKRLNIRKVEKNRLILYAQLHTLKQFFHTFFFDHSICNSKTHILAESVFENNIPVAVNTDLKWNQIIREKNRNKMFISSQLLI